MGAAKRESTTKANTKKFPKYGKNLGQETEYHGKEVEKHNLLTHKKYGERTPTKGGRK